MTRVSSSALMFALRWTLLLCLFDRALAFLPARPAKNSPIRSRSRLYYHPAVEGWEEKYIANGGQPSTDGGPRVISTEFECRAATEAELADLDVAHWPVWTTGDKEKWAVGNQVVNKEMPYGELSFVSEGKLEIIPQSSGKPVVVKVGDLVTFPKGFVASWQVVEELTWNYYLY